MAPLRVGLVGLGAITQRGILPHLALEDARRLIELRTVCDVDADRATAIAEQWGVSWETDLDRLLTNPDLDAVLLATPIGLHYEQVLAALRARKHVYVQKPMTTTVSEADVLIAVAAEANMTLAASPGQMLCPSYQRIRALVSDGTVGRPYWAIGTTAYVGHEHDAIVDPSWYYRAGGGPLYDMGVYTLHALTGILGPARRVTAMSGVGLVERQWRDVRIPVEADDNTLLLVEFPESVFATVTSHYCANGETLGWGFLGLYGSAGSVEVTELEAGSAHARRFRLTGADGSSTEISGRSAEDPHVALPESHVWFDIRDFAEAALAGREPVASAVHARHVVEIMDCAYTAARTGQTQQLATTF